MAFGSLLAEQQTSTIAALFADAFGVEHVSPDSDFFELGGDSLIAASLVNGIEQHFGKVLSISVLFEAPTPRQLAGIVETMQAGASSRLLLPIRINGARPPIFCVHGNNGESVLPPRLSVACGDRQFYALRASGLEGGEQILTSVEAIASNYLVAIGEASERPLVVLGHCGGSLIAYEMARQLAAAGKPPLGLVLIDPPADKHLAPHLFESGLALGLRQTERRRKVEMLERKIASENQATSARRRSLVTMAIEAAVSVYPVASYSGPTLIFCTAERTNRIMDPKRGYPRFLSNLQAVTLGVDHGQMFRTELARIGDAIDSFIAGLTP
jgi:thioesterase domain-containing protein/acyl carrier protein